MKAHWDSYMYIELRSKLSINASAMASMLCISTNENDKNMRIESYVYYIRKVSSYKIK